MNESGCKGINCGCTDGKSHSPECLAEHEATVCGAFEAVKMLRTLYARCNPAPTIVDRVRAVDKDLRLDRLQDRVEALETELPKVREAANRRRVAEGALVTCSECGTAHKQYASCGWCARAAHQREFERQAELDRERVEALEKVHDGMNGRLTYLECEVDQIKSVHPVGQRGVTYLDGDGHLVTEPRAANNPGRPWLDKLLAQELAVIQIVERLSVVETQLALLGQPAPEVQTWAGTGEQPSAPYVPVSRSCPVWPLLERVEAVEKKLTVLQNDFEHHAYNSGESFRNVVRRIEMAETQFSLLGHPAPEVRTSEASTGTGSGLPATERDSERR